MQQNDLRESYQEKVSISQCKVGILTCLFVHDGIVIGKECPKFCWPMTHNLKHVRQKPSLRIKEKSSQTSFM